jgi:hypothetical protein
MVIDMFNIPNHPDPSKTITSICRDNRIDWMVILRSDAIINKIEQLDEALYFKKGKLISLNHLCMV